MIFRKLSAWIAAAALLLLSFSGAAADAAFTEFVNGLKRDQTIPADKNGTFSSYGDYIEELANMHTGVGIPLLQAENFVFSANIGYTSGSRTPDASTAGCGIYFSSREDAYSYMMVTARMDGLIYLSGSNSGRNLSYWKYNYASPNVESTFDLAVVRNGSNVYVYLNGEQLTAAKNIPVFGDLAGLAVLSGTNADFGTRFEFKNISFYTWEDAAADE